jgi:DNA-binding NtrC family response regulator
MSTQSEILTITSRPRERGFSITTEARDFAAGYFTSQHHGDEFDATAGQLSDATPGEEQPRRFNSPGDYRADAELASRPHIEIPPGTSLEELERAAVEKALQVHRGNRTHAAKTLGISVRTLQRKLKAWRIPAMTIQQHMPGVDYSSQFAG